METAPWGFGHTRPQYGQRTKPIAASAQVYTPPGWPTRVLPPGAPEWEASASAFLFDACPPDSRGYSVLRRHPVILARFAAVCVAAQVASTKAALAACRADLAGLASGAAIDDAAAAWGELEASLQRTAREVALVEEALRGRAFVRRL